MAFWLDDYELKVTFFENGEYSSQDQMERHRLGNPLVIDDLSDIELLLMTNRKPRNGTVIQLPALNKNGKMTDIQSEIAFRGYQDADYLEIRLDRRDNSAFLFVPNRDVLFEGSLGHPKLISKNKIALEKDGMYEFLMYGPSSNWRVICQVELAYKKNSQKKLRLLRILPRNLAL